MKLKAEDISTNEKISFEQCKLGRDKYAHTLTKLLQHGGDGCVISLNGEWGYGKTTFVRMWQNLLEEQGFTSLYFNAWQSDFSLDPIIPLFAELKEQLPQLEEEEQANKLLNTFNRIVFSCGKGLVKTQIKKHLGEEALNAFSETSDTIFEDVSSVLSNYLEEKKSIDSFREHLSSIAYKIEKKPLIFFVDELDRCNPHYSVKVLERIKHLFSVPGIVFVLAIDKQQLQHAIRGYYGSEQINAEEYLRRFIDIEYMLPKPNYEAYIEYLLDELDYKSLLKTRVQLEEFKKMVCHLLLFSERRASLRQIQKLLTHTQLSLGACSDEAVCRQFPSTFFLVSFLRFFEPDLYLHLINRDIDEQDLLNKLEQAVSISSLVGYKEHNTRGNCSRYLTGAICEILLRYSHLRVPESNEFDRVFTYGNSGYLDINLILKPQFISHEYLTLWIASIIKKGYYLESGLDVYLKYIDLLHIDLTS